MLKIGMTTRNVLKRCREINSATGVVFPYSPRKVFRVKESKEAERIVHQVLEEYRIRADREFFKCDYSEACKLIEDCLQENELLYYKY
ncbi:MAG: GIY-YIG nuclease family protein [Clostridium sp.]|nr:GIY-YIG nuclease family protein [Clostridium sp.]